MAYLILTQQWNGPSKLAWTGTRFLGGTSIESYHSFYTAKLTQQEALNRIVEIQKEYNERHTVYSSVHYTLLTIQKIEPIEDSDASSDSIFQALQLENLDW